MAKHRKQVKDEVVAEWSAYGRGELRVPSLSPGDTWPFFKLSPSGLRLPTCCHHTCPRRVPVYEEVTICNEDLPPWAKSGPDAKDYLDTVNSSICEVSCSIMEVLQAMREEKAHREFPWVQDLATINSKNVIFVEAVKVCEKKLSNVKFHGKPVVTVKRKCECKLVLIFSQPIDAKMVPALKHMIREALFSNVKPYMSGNWDTNFKFANLYLDHAKPRTNITSLKVSLEEFCSHINNTECRYVTSAIVLNSFGAADGSETKKMSEKTEEIGLHTNPMQHSSKDYCFGDQKHPTNLHDNLNSLTGRHTFGSASNMAHTMPNAEVQDKALNLGSQSNDKKNSDSQRDDQEGASDTHVMRQFHRQENLTNECESHGSHYTLKSKIKNSSRDAVQICSDSKKRNTHPLQNEREEPLSTVCDSHYSDCLQANDTFTLLNEGTVTSGNDGKHLLTVHSPVEPKTKYTKFRCMAAVCDEDWFGLRRKYFGLKSNSKEEKVIILIGNEGSGKTTLINFAANFFKGIEAVDDVIINQICDDSHTNIMTAYTFCFAEDDVPITIIDTPGLKDIRGTEEINALQVLKDFFTSNHSNIQLHAIGYVISSRAVGLSSSERHMIDFLIENYGQGISTNFITFVTFAESKIDSVSDIFKSDAIKSKVLLKFNNTALSMKEIDDCDRFYWKMGIRSWKRCIKVLKELPPLTINTLGVKQKQIYSTCLVKSVEDRLKNELRSFIMSFIEINSLTKPIQEMSEKIWQSAMALYHLISSSDCSFSNVESVLVKYVDEVAKETSLPPKDCVMLLSLSPSRGLLEAGKRMIEFMGPIYDHTKTCSLQSIPVGKEPEVLYCKKCLKHHSIFREECKSEKVITYHCRDCSCDQSDHLKPRFQSKPENKCYLPVESCLKHTKNAIESILQKFSVPGHVLNIRIYLEFVSQNLDEQFKDFIVCIMNSESTARPSYLTHERTSITGKI